MRLLNGDNMNGVLKPVKTMIVDSILPLVVEYRYKGCYTGLRDVVYNDPIPCRDYEVWEFAQQLISGVSNAKLTISDTPNVSSNEVFPVELWATKLPDERYYLQLTGYDIAKEYILDPEDIKY